MRWLKEFTIVSFKEGDTINWIRVKIDTYFLERIDNKKSGTNYNLPNCLGNSNMMFNINSTPFRNNINNYLNVYKIINIIDEDSFNDGFFNLLQKLDDKFVCRGA